MKDIEDKPPSGRLMQPLEAWLAAPTWHLRFAPELEAFFEEETGAPRRRWLVLGGAVGIAAFMLFSLTDASMFGAGNGMAQQVRTRLFLPASLALLLAVHLQRRACLRELLDGCLSLAAQASLLRLLLELRHPNAGYYVFGIAFVALYSLTIARLRFPFALGLAALVWLGFLVALPHIPSLPASTRPFQLALITASMGLGLFANHAMERTTRTSYLQFLSERLREESLTRDNASLSALAGTDPLTGIANRRTFDDVLRSAQGSPDGCALAIIDIDHFKAYNDTYGHAGGDLCLQVFAGNLRLNLRGQDFVARIGGEEFALVLPGAPPEEAIRVVERLQESFREYGLPHEASPTAPHVTFSAGIALCRRDEGQDLFERADAALYRTKAGGRNGWRMDGMPRAAAAGDQ